MRHQTTHPTRQFVGSRLGPRQAGGQLERRAAVPGAPEEATSPPKKVERVCWFLLVKGRKPEMNHKSWRDVCSFFVKGSYKAHDFVVALHHLVVPSHPLKFLAFCLVVDSTKPTNKLVTFAGDLGSTCRYDCLRLVDGQGANMSAKELVNLLMAAKNLVARLTGWRSGYVFGVACDGSKRLRTRLF